MVDPIGQLFGWIMSHLTHRCVFGGHAHILAIRNQKSKPANKHHTLHFWLQIDR